MTRRVNIGRTGAPHGVRGWIKVFPLTDDPGRFELLERILIKKPRGKEEEFSIEGVKYQVDRVLLKLSGVDDREAASILRNRLVRIPESEVVPIEEEDVYYYYQLEGLEVRCEDGETLGKLTSIQPTGGNDVYYVRGEDGKEHLVPALKKCVKSVDIDEGVMIVNRDWVT